MVSFCDWSHPGWYQMVERWVWPKINQSSKMPFTEIFPLLPILAHDCVTVNVCRHDWSWGKKFKQKLWSAGLKRLHLNLLEMSLACMYLTILTCSVVHNQAFQSVMAVCFISGLCGRDAHPQGCSWGQPGMYQSSLDLGSKSWVSHVIRSVFLLFLYYQHFCSTFARDHHQTLL